MVASCETTIALLANKRFLASMFPIMSSKLIGPGELPITVGPRTLIRLLAGMRSIVLLEMRALEIGLCTTGISTLEIPRPSSSRGSSSGRRRRIARCGVISRGADRIGTLSILFDTQRLRLLLVEIEAKRNISRRRITSSRRRTSRISVVPTVHSRRGRCGRGRVIGRLAARRYKRVGERGRVTTVVPERRRLDFNRHCWAVLQRAALDFLTSNACCFGC